MTQDREKAVAANKDIWDAVVEAHAGSELYGLEAFLAGENKLGEVERREVGDVAGKRLLHPLCHFGLDSLSWARLGAEVTGLDISPKAVAKAKEIASRAGLDADFVTADISGTTITVELVSDVDAPGVTLGTSSPSTTSPHNMRIPCPSLPTVFVKRLW